MANKPPRPNKNADGLPKQPSQNPTGGAPAAPPTQGPPSLVPPGGPPAMHQVQQRINFKDMPPMAQAQTEEQLGLNPGAPLQMIQQQLQSSMMEPGGPMQPQGGPVPASFMGPMVPPGVENFPHDMGALMQVMQRGFAPGADNGEHEMALNAHSMARAAEQSAQNQAAQTAHQSGVQAALGGLMQHMQMATQIPTPQAAAAALPQTHRRQLSGSY